MGQTPRNTITAAPEGLFEPAETPESEALDTYANNSSAPTDPSGLETAIDQRERAAKRRAERFRRQEILWRASSIERVRKCCRVSRGDVAVRITAETIGVAGLTHCGSVWACPSCSARILARRGQEIGSVLTEAHEQGHRLAFLTLTMHHRKGQRLADLWDAAGTAWGRATSGRAWTAAQDRHGLVGWVRVWEVTQGERNGWHVHVHVALVLEPDATADDLEQIGSGMFARWSDGLVAAGLKAPQLKGQDWQLVDTEWGPTRVAEYMAKLERSGASRGTSSAQLGLELTHTNPGRARSGFATRPVSDLLADLEATGEKSALTGWHEWEQASRGRRQLGWSKGLRERFTQMEEMTDAEIVAEELGTSDDDVIVLPTGSWAAIVAVPGRRAEMYEVGERDGLPGLAVLLSKWGIPYRVP